MTCLGNPPSHLFLTNTGTLELALVYCYVWSSSLSAQYSSLGGAGTAEVLSLDLLGLYLCAAFGLHYICYPNVELKSLQAGINSTWFGELLSS